MKKIDAFLRRGGEFWYFGKSALDRYENKKPAVISVATTAGLGELAGSFEGIFYPGLDSADAALIHEGVTILVTTVDSPGGIPRFSLAPFNMLYSVSEGEYLDREGEYNLLGKGRTEGMPVSSRDWTHLLRRMAWSDGEAPGDSSPLSFPPSLLRERDRFFLEDILTGPSAHAALSLLWDKGWISAHFPPLAQLARVEQNKEFHPEGNVWEHTLETLKYRKERPLNLSLSLLFHDLGKGRAEEVGQNRFHGHAQIGADLLRPLLREWGFPDDLINEVAYLVGHHMMPAAIERLPYHKKQETIENDLFPQLLELYRCDLSSSFHGLDGYYDACRYYKSFRRNRKNPYRKADGSLKRGAS
jgi:poly(A) polymerase